MTFWDDIFGQLTQGPLTQSLAGPPPIDERVNPPTPTEREGLEGSIIGSMWDDPIALLGSQRGVIDWFRPTRAGTEGTYIPTGWPEASNARFHVPPGETPGAGRREDTIRFPLGRPSLWPGDTGRYVVSPEVAYSTHPSGATARTRPVARYGGAGSDPSFAEIGRHEFRHRGLYNLSGAASEYGVPLDPSARPLTGPGFASGESINVLQDRRLGWNESYPGMVYTPNDERFYGAMLDHLRTIADEINARRVQRMISTGGRWSDQP